MNLLAPLAFGALAVPLAIYLIHWLFGARRRVRVPALFLWADLPQARAGRARRRIPPFSWLLLLQLAAAVAGVLALARPAVPMDPPRHIALVLDASATMQATDVSPTRFDVAKRSAQDRLDGLRPTDLVSLIRAGKDATLLASGPPGTVRSSLRSTSAGLTAPAIREALALASSRVAATPERHGEILLFSDVAWAQPESVGPLAAPLEVIPTGGGSNNQAITRVIVRLDPSGRSQTAFLELANLSDRAARVPVSMTADGAPLDRRQVDMAARSRLRLSIPVPLDARRIAVRLEGKDSLPVDDTFETIAPGGPPRQVELAGRVSDGLRRAIESAPWLHVRAADASQPPDLTVLAGVLPALLPAGPLLLVDPPPNSARLLGVGLGSAMRVQPEHAVLQGLDLVSLRDEFPSVSGVPGWAHVVLGTEQGPLIMEGRLEGHPVVSLTFDPTISGFEKSIAFPLLISNATSYLLTQAETPQANAPKEAFDPAESDIAPRAMPTFATSAPVEASTAGSADIWPWLAGGMLALLGAEWIVFARRG